MHECFAFVACVLVVASSLIKIVDKPNIQRQPNVTQMAAVHLTHISANVIEHFVFSDAMFLKIVG